MILRYVKLTGSEKWFEHTSRAMTRSLMSGDQYVQDGDYFPFIRHKTPHKDSLFNRVNHFILVNHLIILDLLYCAIKRTLNSGRKDDPDVRVEIDVLEDVFNDVLGNVVDSKWERGKLVHIIPTNRVLDNVLGLKWDEWIVNIQGDFCCIAKGRKYVKSEIEGCCMVVFTFVRGTGNRMQYEQRD